jgi:hypothetical protein
MQWRNCGMFAHKDFEIDEVLRNRKSFSSTHITSILHTNIRYVVVQMYVIETS